MESDFSKKLQKNEKISIESGILTKKDLYQIVWGDHGSLIDSRFAHTEDGGVFRHFNPHKISQPFRNLVFSMVKENGKIVGLSELEKNPHLENHYWVQFVSVDPDYQGKSYASKLIEELFKFAHDQKITIESSAYNGEGEMKLKRKMNEFAQKYDVPFIDREREYD